MAAARFQKVVVIGLDGLEPAIVEPLLAQGALPNLARLAAKGSHARIGTTSPAQTPVAWSTFAMGLNPGGHGIFDFLKRDPKTYLPDLALSRYEQKNAFLPPRAVNLRKGEPVWEKLARAGVGSTILRCPCTYPAEASKGRLLAGMGVPDLRGGLGTGTFYTSCAGATQGESETLVRLESAGPVDTHLVGPRHPKTRADVLMPVRLVPDQDLRRLVVRSDGAPGELVVEEGRWSGWLRVQFKLGLLQAVRGLVRFYLKRLGPELELYASPIQFDPQAPVFPISAPEYFAADLEDAIGPFHTAGMVEDHAALSNGRIDEAAFLDQCATAWQERTAMMQRALERFDAGLFYCLFDTPDRVQHLFWRHREPEHPANRVLPAEQCPGAIEDQYRRADAVVGQVLDQADEQTLIIALSDHGFSSFQRGVDLNGWLQQHGYLALREDCEPSDLLRSIDWKRTRAYALGLGGIYLNLQGREGQGIVPPDEADGLRAAIARGLLGLFDAERGRKPVRSVRPREELYQGPYAADAPDLVVNFDAGYRVSWSSSLGGVGNGLVEDNTRAWSGDHLIDPALVPGVLFLSQPMLGARPHLVDLAPTILTALGLPADPALEGRSLLP